MKKAYISPFVEVIESEPEVLLESSQETSTEFGNKGYNTMGDPEPDEVQRPIKPVWGDGDDDWSTL